MEPTALFEPEGDVFLPTELAQSPWGPVGMNGAAIAGLIGYLVERAIGAEPMILARLTIDILSVAPREPTIGRVTDVKSGRRLRLLDVELVVAGRTVARASALLMRRSETPPVGGELCWPLPDGLPPLVRPGDTYLGGRLQRRIVHGRLNQAGPGAMWVKLGMDVIAGTPLSPLCHAVVAGDFGSMIGSSHDLSQWTFPNVDITLHFSRHPRGEWLMIEATSESAGNGLIATTTTFADVDGIYCRGHQSLFLQSR
jgi:hypothetical protein